MTNQIALNLIDEIETNKSSKYKFDGELLKRNGLIVVLSKKIQKKILKMQHENLTSGHPGTEKTLELITRQYTWPKITKTIQKYITECQTCCRNKNSTKNPSGSLVSHPILSKPFEIIAMDFISNLLSKLPKDPFNSVQGIKLIDSTEERIVQQDYR
jgi:hypothetical protein